MTDPSGLDYYGEFSKITHLLVVKGYLEDQALDHDLLWVLPPDVLAGATTAYGIDVIRADVPFPMLAHRGEKA